MSGSIPSVRAPGFPYGRVRRIESFCAGLTLWAPGVLSFLTGAEAVLLIARDLQAPQKGLTQSAMGTEFLASMHEDRKHTGIP